jgi:hypothetical protein
MRGAQDRVISLDGAAGCGKYQPMIVTDTLALTRHAF